MGNHVLRKLKEGRVLDSDGATGAHHLVGARPVEHGCGSYFGSVKGNSNSSWGSGLPPPLGKRGGPPRNFHSSSKNARGFLQSHNFLISPGKDHNSQKNCGRVRNRSQILGYFQLHRNLSFFGMFLAIQEKDTVFVTCDKFFS